MTSRMTYPLPNEVKHVGDLCPKSFASHPLNHVHPMDVEGWGICVDCGEVVNLRRGEIPEHRIPIGPVEKGPSQ